MDNDDLQRLSRIKTVWSHVYQAHGAAPPAVHQAQARLLERYSGAVHRYLCGALRDQDAADELFQDFVLRFLRGDFRNASHERGRFRDFVKTCLYHLVCDHHKRQKRAPLALGQEDNVPAAGEPSLEDLDRELVGRWRDEILDCTWRALKELEESTGQPCYTVLRLRTQQPLLSSAELAEHLSTRLGRSFTVDGLRQALRRARERFTDLLLAEVKRSLDDPSLERLEEELIDLNLYTYCKQALVWDRKS